MAAAVVAAALAVACDTKAPAAPTAGDAPVLRGPTHLVIEPMSPAAMAAQPLLPAFETAAERLDVAKNDAASDYRNANRQYFANTKPLPDDAFRPFGEWEEMSQVWTTYSSGMPGSPAVRRMFAEQTIHFIRDSKPTVEAYVIVPSEANADDFTKAVNTYGIQPSELEHLHFVQLPNQTIWHIDYGPFPLLRKADGVLAFSDFIYYPNRHIDDAIPSRLAFDFFKDVTVYRMPFPFEGGNIQADSVEKCMTSDRALSNTGFSAAKVRNVLHRWAGCKETFIVKDITDDGTGHIDMFFKWSATDEVVFGRYDDEITLDYDGDGKEETLPIPGAVAPDYKATHAKNKQRMDDNAAMMAAATSAKGTPYKVHRLPMMTHFKDQYGDLPRTFINSTFTNGVNVYPSYTEKSCRAAAGAACKVDADCAAGEHCAAGKCTKGPAASGCDELVKCGAGQECVTDPLKVKLIAKAQGEWEAAMPSWKHVGLRADTIGLWSGAIHCITRTIPKTTHAKVIPDALCLGGECACVDGGADNTCNADGECQGPAWVCNCQICKGTCADGKTCTDDADCAKGGPIVVGSCLQDRKQACTGETSGGGSACGALSWEGSCNGNSLEFCSAGKPKTLACGGGGCCGWSDGDGSFACLSGAACGGSCIAECGKAGDKGCSAEGTHAWTCEDVGGCLKRKWLPCDLGCSLDTSACKVPGAKPVCPTPGEDTSSGGDTAGGDGGAVDPDAAGGDAAPQGDAVTGGDAGADVASNVAPPSKSSGGCSAAAAPRGHSGWWWTLALAGLLVAFRRRRSLGA